ncbi:MAG: hypothetical protein LBS20_20335 [Prevotella sp.]|jgi:archaellum component FlaC|nr:hypothetical protein [Prevotella sp.]
MKSEIEKLEEEIRELEFIIEVYTSNEQLRSLPHYTAHIDSILDEINKKRKQIEKLKE